MEQCFCHTCNANLSVFERSLGEYVCERCFGDDLTFYDEDTEEDEEEYMVGGKPLSFWL